MSRVPLATLPDDEREHMEGVLEEEDRFKAVFDALRGEEEDFLGYAEFMSEIMVQLGGPKAFAKIVAEIFDQLPVNSPQKVAMAKEMLSHYRQLADLGVIPTGFGSDPSEQSDEELRSNISAIVSEV